MVVMAVTHENHRCTIGRSRQQPFYHRGVGGNRSAKQPSKQAWPPLQKRGIAEERSRQESVPAVLYQDSGNAEISDGNLIARISAIGRDTPDGVRCRYNLVPNDRL